MKARLGMSPLGRIAAIVALAAALAGCAGSPQGVNPVSPPTPPRHLAACDVGRLQIIIDPSAAQPYPHGGSYLPIDFINHSGSACKISGYPRVVAVTATGKHNAVASRRHMHGLGKPLLLAPDYTAHAWLLVANAPAGKTAGCRPFTSTELRVVPPGTTGAFVPLTWRLKLCVPPNTAALSIQEVQQGLASASTFP